MHERRVLIISGTNRPGSVALRLARILSRHYRAVNALADVYSLAELPPEVFLPEAYARKPAAFAAVQERVLAASGLHIVCPEYNGSYPGVLKYFIDLLKFPESFERKPVALVGEAAGTWGALRAVEQLQMVFGYRNAYLYPDRVFIPIVHERLDQGGSLNDADLDARLARQVRGFVGFIGCIGAMAK